MCRALLYLGQPIAVKELLYEPDNSIIKQTYNPQQMTLQSLNLSGFGMAAWSENLNEPGIPLIYKTPQLPFFDKNLKNFSRQVVANSALMHVRGTAYLAKEIIVRENAHPFLFRDTNIIMAHNGFLSNFNKLKVGLFKAIKPEFMQQIQGTTDSEWIYALLLSQFANADETHSVKQIADAIYKTFNILSDLLNKHRVEVSSPVNLFVTNGKCIVATRLVFDYGHFLPEKSSGHFRYHSLWYTYGKNYECNDNQYKMTSGAKKSVIIASEPLTIDTTTWIEVPEYSLVTAEYHENEIIVKDYDIDI